MGAIASAAPSERATSPRDREVSRDQLCVHGAGDEWLQRRPGAGWPKRMEAPLRQVRDAGREAEAKDMGQGEDMGAMRETG
jgi:hypothetical protein